MPNTTTDDLNFLKTNSQSRTRSDFRSSQSFTGVLKKTVLKFSAKASPHFWVDPAALQLHLKGNYSHFFKTFLEKI